MKNHTLCFLLVFLSSLSAFAQQTGCIIDPDGYTNLREKATSQSNIVTVVKLGDEFVYTPENTSNWSKVIFKDFSGYVHNSRIQNLDSITSKITDFYRSYYQTTKKNADLTEANNTQLFEFAKIYPLATLKAFYKVNLNQQKFILYSFRNSLNDHIDFKLIYTNMTEVPFFRMSNQDIVDAIGYTAEKIGYKKNLNRICELYLINKTISNADLLKLVPKNNSQLELYYATTGPEHKLYNTSFFYDTTNQIFEQIISNKNEDFYIPSLQLSSFADGEFAEEFIENLKHIIEMDNHKFCKAVTGKEFAKRNPIKYYFETHQCE